MRRRFYFILAVLALLVLAAARPVLRYA